MPPAAERPMRLDAAAGGAGGSWYVLLEGLAGLVREVHLWIELRVVEGGGVMNHAKVGTGQPPVAILNPPMTVAARTGRPPFGAAFPDLRVGIANLTVNRGHGHLARLSRIRPGGGRLRHHGRHL